MSENVSHSLCFWSFSLDVLLAAAWNRAHKPHFLTKNWIIKQTTWGGNPEKRHKSSYHTPISYETRIIWGHGFITWGCGDEENTNETEKKKKTQKKEKKQQKWPWWHWAVGGGGGGCLRGHDYVCCLWLKSLQQACFWKKKLFKGGFLNADLELKILTGLKSAWENTSVASRSGEVNSINLTGLKTPWGLGSLLTVSNTSSFPDKTHSSRADDCHVAHWSFLVPYETIPEKCCIFHSHVDPLW